MSPAPLRTPVHALLTLLLTLGALVFVPTTAQAAEPTPITTGSVTWGIKDSWRKYIGDGSEASDGATITGWSADGSHPLGFSFPVEGGSYDPETRTTTLDLQGTVHFRSWYGYVEPGKWALDTKYSDLSLTIGPDAQEIRGTHTGYSRSDPGGELHEDVDVVLATFDVSAAEPVLGPPTTTWENLPTMAGPGFGIYGEGLQIDPVSITYEGPGGKPNLEETFDQAGQPILRSGGTAWYESLLTNGSGGQRAAVASDAALYTAEIESLSATTMTVRAFDPATMEQVARHDVPMPSMTVGGTSGRQIRLTVDHERNRLFYATTFDGGDGMTAHLRSITFDPATKSFTDPTVIGPLSGAAVYGTRVAAMNITNLAWDAERGRLAVLSELAEKPAMALGQLRVYTEGEDGWSVETGNVTLPATGRYASATAVSPTTTVGRTTAEPVLATLGDGSWVLATSSSSASPRPVVRLDSLHLDLRDGEVVTTPIDGTAHTTTVGGTYYGYHAAVPGPDGSVYLHGRGQSVEDIAQVTLVDGVAVAGEALRGEDALPPYGYSLMGASVAYAADAGRVWFSDETDSTGKRIKLLEGDDVVASYPFADWTTNHFGYAHLLASPDGTLYAPVRDGVTGRFGYRLVDTSAVAPSISAQPEDVSVVLGTQEESRAVTFTSGTDGAGQWQVKDVGSSRFTAVDGATSGTLTVQASPTTAGNAYRYVATNEHGKSVSDVATLDVEFGPRFVSQPRNVKTTSGTIAQFNADVTGSPALTSTAWQRKVGGFWADVPLDSDDLTVAGTSLTVRETDADQDGAQFRLKAVNTHGTAYSNVARLTVDDEREAGEVSGAELLWTGSKELQASPPFGGSNYFSAGVSDGDEATYRASDGSVSIVHLDGDDRTPATWATRALQVGTDADQAVAFADGTGTVEADGSATIAWKGSWSINFYGGLLPFTVTDPVLEVEADGDAALTADLSGWSSSQANPESKERVETVKDVTVATFSGVRVDEDGFTIAPHYEGVEVSVPSGVTAQQRTGSGWGAWPQKFVDFHVRTGLSSYWYSSGGAADPLKSGAPVVVGAFEVDAAQPVEPVAAPVIVTQPSSQRTTVVRTASFGVDATGADLAYQWQKQVGSSWFDLSGQQGPRLTLRSVRPADAGRYRVVVSNEGGRVTSTVATLATVASGVKVSTSLSRTTQKFKAKASSRIRMTVTLKASNGTTPTGRVRLYDGKKLIGSVKATRGKAVFRLPAKLSVGRHTLQARYTPYTPSMLSANVSPKRTVRVLF